MGVPKLTRQLVIAGKVESTAGSFEALAAANATMRVIAGANADVNYPTEDRDIARGSLTPLGLVSGEKSLGYTFRSEVNTADTVTSDLEQLAFMEGCGITIDALKQITVGTVNGGPFQRNETITDESANTGTCKLALAAAGQLYHVAGTGTLQDAETLTGGTSGATATSSSAVSDAGGRGKPTSDNQKTISMQLQQDGANRAATGVMGNLVMTVESSKRGFWDFTMQGPRHSTDDLALLTGISYNNEQPAILQNASLTINGQTPVWHSVSIDFGNNVVLRKDANATDTGFISARITKRDPVWTVLFEQLPTGTLDIPALMDAETKMQNLFRIGTAAGKTFWFFQDYAQVMSISPQDVDGILMMSVEFKCTGQATSAEDEIEFIYF